MTTVYCVKCKKKKEMTGAKKTKTKNGRNAMKGKCTTCGTKMIHYVKKVEQLGGLFFSVMVSLYFLVLVYIVL